MIELLNKPLTKYTLAALLLTTILTGMVVSRIQHLRNGREIVLDIRPVDPRDLFKGDYVRLGFDISRAAKEAPWTVAAGRDVAANVLIEQAGAEGQWKVVSVTPERPRPAANQIALKARASSGFLRYGIERYYVPEGTGPTLEGQARSGKLAAIVAVDAKGNSAIKGLKLDGKVIHVEPVL